MNLNFKKLKSDINRISNQIKFMRANGKTFLNGWEISDLKKRVTILCSIKAEHRQRLHLMKVRNPHAGLEGQPKLIARSREDQVKLISLSVKDYEQKEAERPASLS